MTMKQLIRLMTMTALLAAQAGAREPMDPPGKPNEDIYDIIERLAGDEMTLAQRAEYFTHYSPVVRREASKSLMREGKKAMPLITKALKSKDKRVIRAGTDALSGPFGVGMVGRGRRELQAVMTPDIAGAAAPLLAKLLDHDDLYVRDGALLALSNCGKATVPYLDKVVKMTANDHWWVRSSASKVIKRVGAPQSDKHAETMTRKFVAEPYVYPKRRLQEMVIELVKTGGKKTQVLQIVADALPLQKRDYFRYLLLEGLYKLGPDAAGALGGVEKLMAQEQQALARAPRGERAAIEKEIAYIQKVLDRIKPSKAGKERPRR
ncbi:MAG: hypothetical protein ISS78_11685 [Phycisphaerae bacterium]|nr:hypothetical protein [Phycisphaerae bacterium]